MNPSEKFNLENPLVKYNQILEELRSEGKELDEKFAEQIQWNRDQCFESMEVSSPEELNRELSPETGASAKFPVGFDFDVDFAGYHCEIGALKGGTNRYVYLSRKKKEKDEERAMEEGETEKILNLINEKIGSKQRIIGYIWEADGIRHKGKLLKYDHLGVVVDKEARGEDVGFAIYRLHEAVFGERKKEITPKLSILKLYMKLGFVPKKIINPENGEELPIRAGKMVEGNFSKGNENFVFLVYLEKEKEN